VEGLKADEACSVNKRLNFAKARMGTVSRSSKPGTTTVRLGSAMASVSADEAIRMAFIAVSLRLREDGGDDRGAAEVHGL
jgi:hypothetical protein